MHIKNILLLVIAFILLSSCASVKKVRYFQDVQAGIAEQVISPQAIKISPGDKISISVSSKDQQMAATFNLLVAESRAGSSLSSTSGRNSGYTVDKQGEIKFPILGRFHVEGMTKEEVAIYIETELIQRNLLKDPIVIVDFLNLGISVMGEVNKPGRFNIERDNITLLEALSMAGDLTIYANRERVIVMREKKGQQMPYFVDLCSAKQLYSSPVYYLQQNDVIYVEPNSMRTRQSTINGNNVRSASFWMSLTSLLTSITFFILK